MLLMSKPNKAVVYFSEIIHIIQKINFQIKWTYNIIFLLTILKKRFCECWIIVGKEPNTYTGNSLESALARNAVSVGHATRDGCE